MPATTQSMAHLTHIPTAGFRLNKPIGEWELPDPSDYSDPSSFTSCIHARQNNSVSQQEWHHSRGNPLLIPLNDENTIAPDTDVMQALALMNRTGNSRLIVKADNRLVGIVALKDILKFLSLKLDLEGIR
jgi:hypothetical protein